MEGDYIPKNVLRRYHPAYACYPHLGMDGHFDREQHGGESVIQRHILREHGVVLAGPPPKTLIDPVQPDELRQAVREVLHEWWAPMLNDPSRLHNREYQAYAVLTMCRALYTLQHGIIVSKTVAAQWAQEVLGVRWAGLIRQGLMWQHETQTNNLNETLDFIRFTISQQEGPND
ncbi:MAG: aminoglycoside adenylyltransferase domain-containing protein [Chloroflexota bacterium]